LKNQLNSFVGGNVTDNLKLKPIAIGSLPCDNIEDAMNIVKRDFYEIPFFPQLARVQKNEDMIVQLLEGMPGIDFSKNPPELIIDPESEAFYEDLEQFFADYEEISANPDSELLNKYGISKEFSSTFPELLKIVSKSKPQYAKGQVVGPFTLSTSLNDISGNSLIFDETLRDIVIKLLCLKVLWQIKQIKRANPSTTPIIFLDEPSISQLGTSAYITIPDSDVLEMLKEICTVIKQNGGISAIHCCGKCDWSIPIKSGVDMINIDAYSFGKHLSLFANDIDKFIENGGKIVWGLVPTLDYAALSRITVEDLVKKFKTSVNYLTNKGINEKLVIDNSLVTSSCGAGALTVELAQRAMDLVKELSDTLRERF